MTPAGFIHPDWLEPLAALLLLSGLALGAARLWARRRGRALLGAGAPGRVRGLGSDLALFGALLALGIGLLGPRLGERSLWVPSAGVDVVVLVDVSHSMQARDIAPSRLARARESARRLLVRLAPGDRAALAAFASVGVLLTPLTPDTGALIEMLPALDADLIAEGGSQIGAGVLAAVEAFEEGSSRPRVLFLLSDGEQPARSRSLPLDRLSRSGVRVVGVALGTEAGANLLEQGSPLRDSAGEVVVSRRDREPLARLSAASGGELLIADRFGAIDAENALRLVRKDAGRVTGEPIERKVPIPRVAPFAAAAFVLLALELAGAGTLRRRRLDPAWVAAFALVLGAGTALGLTEERFALEARVRSDPEDARALLALGVARAEAGESEAAARALFAAAARAHDRAIAARAYYDLGVVEIQRRRFEAARDAFFDALALNPRDRKAKFNLEWTLHALRAAPPPPSAEPQHPAPPRDARAEPSESERTPSGKEGEFQESKETRPDPGTGDRASKPASTTLSPDEAARWLEMVTDDPSRSLRDTARRATPDRPRRATPQW